MPNVAFVRKELKTVLPEYTLIEDCIAGEPAVKKAGKKYLPMPNADDSSDENVARYNSYKERAVFYNVTKRTLAGLVGTVFIREPEIDLPTRLQAILTNASGTGVSLEQQAKKALSLTLSLGRCGLLVDYPTTETTTVEDVQSGRVRPVLNLYKPRDVVNWRVIDRGAEEVLSLVVLREEYVAEDDGFEMKEAIQYRVLQLVQNVYVQSLWRDKSSAFIEGAEGSVRMPSGHFEMVSKMIPRDYRGNPLSEIPFVFIGSESNDSEVDPAPLYDLASLNIAHYRNSADYEESSFLVGQATPVVSGLTEEWVENVLKGKLAFGSRGGIPLPEGASAELIQAESNTMVKEAMESKERQMVAIGAKLVEQSGVQRTAFETKVETASETSILSSVSQNVSSAYQKTLEIAMLFVGESKAPIFEMNSDFDLARMTAEERQQVLSEWQAGALAFEEMRSALHKAGVATLTDEEARQRIDEEQAASMPQGEEASFNIGQDEEEEGE